MYVNSEVGLPVSEDLKDIFELLGTDEGQRILQEEIDKQLIREILESVKRGN
jgi:hypothetical protein